jgi:putative secretion ATPase (PEP-CTERM system associated)
MYAEYYGFTAKPFQLSPDPEFFFASSGHKRALAYLRYGLSQGEGFIVITGGIGTGKTTLVKSLFKELNANEVIAAQLVTTQLEADDLLRMIVAAFDLPYENLHKAVLIKSLEHFLKDCSLAGKRALLVIDEAQNLPPRSLEELRMLSNFQVSDVPSLQSFLLGQAEFREALQAPGMEQLRQRVIASCHLNPLIERETQDYIEHRLRIAGWRAKPHFTEEAYAMIHRYTQGIPRRINVFCDRLLLYGCLEELQAFSEAAVTAVSRELDQELASQGIVAASLEDIPKRVLPTDAGILRRLTELEQSMVVIQRTLFTMSKTLDADTQTQKNRILSLEKKIDEVESVLKDIPRDFQSSPAGSINR